MKKIIKNIYFPIIAFTLGYLFHSGWLAFSLIVAYLIGYAEAILWEGS